eukprot:CAMPEP_0198722788 /NCGR_PEP_ID=MMETSP1475-20131203/415_1 /TAXON_ID= ORGANISM="Unidentified sp., Strain CCMP1999" /NCGR_SAMPLE_ID=MMETSP1475 /ASSEMBLY_ACC=CAM_ASM_001111 /LENGTH=190 /DNA_ID=CAMNT_0044483711 /DNA_START=44 /DNA_END=616 /DNA_ORIENTATION=-
MTLTEEDKRKAAYVSNGLLTSLGWYTNVLFAANSVPLVGPAIELVIIFIQLSVIVPTYGRKRSNEIKVLAATICTGLVADTLIGWVFGVYPWKVPPPFIIALWANFSMCLNISLEFIHSQPFPWVPAILGAVCGPFTYFSGVYLGAITVPTSMLKFLTVIGAEWAIVFPVLVKLAAHFSKRGSTAESEYV